MAESGLRDNAAESKHGSTSVLELAHAALRGVKLEGVELVVPCIRDSM